MRSPADIFDAWSSPADAPEAGDEDSLLGELETAVVALAVKLRHEPGLKREVAQLFCKTSTNIPGIAFRSIVWPEARRLAGLPNAKAGRPLGSRTRKKLIGRPIS